jgi:hypothetical protein
MLTLKISDASGQLLFEKKGRHIDVVYEGVLDAGHLIRVSIENGDFIALKLDETLEESIVFVPNRSFDFTVPDRSVRAACYAPGAFEGSSHRIIAREVEDDEIYSYRQISLNSHDRHGSVRFFPHASANFVTERSPASTSVTRSTEL